MPSPRPDIGGAAARSVTREKGNDGHRGFGLYNSSFIRTMKRDYARVSPLPDAAAVMRQLPAWFDHYNTVHPHRALNYRSPREFIASRSNPEIMSDL